MNPEKFSKILVAIDGSKNSMSAAEYAVSIAQRNKAELVALHVLHVPNTELYLTSGKKYEEFVDKNQRELDKSFEIISKKAKENQVKFRTEIIKVLPNIAAGIVTYADKRKFDLIIIGTRGRSGFKKLVLGSVASEVVTYSSCPVLVIK